MADSSNSNNTSDEDFTGSPVDNFLNFSDITPYTTSSGEFTDDITHQLSNLNIDQDLVYDFAFQLTNQGKINLRWAISALKYNEFNPSKTGLMHVTEAGFSITVKSSIDPTDKDDYVFGYLRMRKTDLVWFQCNNSVTKIVPLRDVLRLLKASDHEAEVVVFCAQGSNQLTFQFSVKREGAGEGSVVYTFSHVDLTDDINSEYEMFPNVEYVFKEHIHATFLRQFVNSMEAGNRDSLNNSVQVDMWTYGVSMEVGDCKVENPSVKYTVLWTWRHWHSLGKALCVADMGSIYLVNVPPQSVMLKIKLFGVGNVVFLCNAVFDQKADDSISVHGVYRPIV